jgi:hypothetical protein
MTDLETKIAACDKPTAQESYESLGVKEMKFHDFSLTWYRVKSNPPKEHKTKPEAKKPGKDAK